MTQMTRIRIFLKVLIRVFPRSFAAKVSNHEHCKQDR
jgi:hypothetical protein